MGNKITTRDEYLKRITCLEKGLELDKIRFYRGLGNCEYKNYDMPKIFRKNKEVLLRNESAIFSQFVSRAPASFRKCENIFEYLALMQHYGLSTRLLDVTTVAAVALYFACLPPDDKDGEVILYDIPETQVLPHNHSYVDKISYLSQSQFGFNVLLIDLFQDVAKIKNSCHEIIYMLCIRTVHGFMNEQDMLKRFASFADSMLTRCQRMEESYELIHIHDKLTLEYTAAALVTLRASLCGLKSILSIKHMLKNRSSFLLDIEESAKCIYDELISTISSYFPDDHLNKMYPDLENMPTEMFKEPYCIIPKRNNPRLQNQMGAFIILGCDEVTGSKQFRKATPHFKFRPELKTSLIIDKDAKADILQELARGNINKTFLFPELENVAETIEAEYYSKSAAKERKIKKLASESTTRSESVPF